MKNNQEPAGPARDGKLFRRLARYAAPYRKSALTGLLLLLASSGLVVIGPLLIRALIDDGIRKNDARVVALVAVGYFVVELVRFVIDCLQSYCLQKLGQSSMRDLRIEVFRRLQALPLSFYENHRVGDVVTRTTNDIAALNELFSVGLVTLIRDVILIFAVTSTLLVMNIQFGLVTLAASPLVLFGALGLRRILRQTARRVREAISNFNSALQENLNGMKVIHLFDLRRERLSKLHQENDRLCDAALSSVRAHAVFTPIVSVTTALSLGLVFWYGGEQTIRGSITLGLLVAYVQYVPNLLGPVRDLVEKYTILQSGLAAGERIFDVLDSQEFSHSREAVALSNPRGEITAQGVAFGYLPERKIIQGIDLAIEPGEKIALVGKTGAGKTTLSRLFARLYDPWEGAITLDGRDLREISAQDLRRAIVIVPQNVVLFSGTVLDNIRLGDTTISQEQIVRACEVANASEFIKRLPGGFDCNLAEEGKNISSGERQLLALARAVARRPQVLILDEATANVDFKTEGWIVDALDRAMKNRTCIIVAHRLSTIQKVDRVVVIESGRIVEQGPPAALLSNGSFFERISKSQLLQELGS